MDGRRASRAGLAAAWSAAACGWLLGCLLQLQQPALWPLAVYGGLVAAGLACGALARRHLVLAALAGALLGGGATGGQATLRLADALPAALEGQDLVVTGVVAQMPRTGPGGLRFSFDVESARWRGEAVRVPARISLGWMLGIDAGASPDLRAGQRWEFAVRLRQPHGAMNPHGFDLELWLFEQGIRASGSVRSGPDAVARRLADGVAHPFERARQRIRDALFARVPDATAAGVLAALAVGDQAAIERDDWELFRTTGVAHLMSISGLHVTMFAWLAGALAGALWRRSGRLVLACPAPVAARWIGLGAALLYALLAGFGVPAQRTVWMIAVVVALRSLGLRWPLLAVLLAVAVVVTAADPWALLQPGFWLSFVAVALLVASEPALPGDAPATRRERLLAALRGGLRTQAVATIGLAPLSLLFFQQVSLVGFVANLVAIPVVTLLVTPLALLGVLVPVLWAVAAATVALLIAWLDMLAAWPLALWSAAAAPAWAVAAGLLGGALAVLPLPWRLRALAVPLLLPLLAPPVERPAAGQFELVAADVGQGTTVLVRTAHRLLVYDTGPSYSAEADAGQRVLLPLLRARGERGIDLLVLSHQDNDHVGGAATLLAALPVTAIAGSLPDAHPLLAHSVAQRRCEAGQSWDWDGVRFEFLHPVAEAPGAATRPNALSCVLRVQGTAGSALLAGDIEAAQEAALLARGAAALRSDVLLVPHHGSRTSSTPAFVDAVAPRVAVVQAAYRSRFGHPAPDVEARYASRGIELVRSDRCGAWTWISGRPAVCERLAARRYWHHPSAAGPP